jgi:uncharacterized membrane protein YeaQ/YmgE (transglycosylase-associated protein family)
VARSARPFQAIVGFSIGGFLLSWVLGFIGAMLGLWAGTQLNLPALLVMDLGGQTYALLWPIIGALLFAIVLSLVAQRLLVDA